MIPRFLLLISLLVQPVPGIAANLVIAVAANFAPVARTLVEHFESETGHDVDLVIGATGLLYAQIVRDAPFDVFLAADTTRPQRLIERGMAGSDDVHIYAMGRLALWVPGTKQTPALSSLGALDNRHLAIANPRLAPYGRAAQVVIDQSSLVNTQNLQLIVAENVAGAYSLIASGNAGAGFVALSQLLANGVASTDYKVMPETAYSLIEQGAIITRRGRYNETAHRFMAFLRSESSVALIRQAGYHVPATEAQAP